MRTVKEVSELTGVSVRTLHYYDEIGLFSPTEKSGTGYRLYDDKALETLQQILFFREFDIPLKEIKAIMQNPAFDRNQILKCQKKMLIAKKERIERLILGIDDILKGDKQMDFAVFDRSEMEEMFQRMYERMPEKIRKIAVDEFGGIEEWKKNYMETVSSEEMQKRYGEVFEWYGGKEAFMNSGNRPHSRDVAASHARRLEEIFQEFAQKRSCPPDSPEVEELAGEYGRIMKQLTQVEDEAGMMRYLAWFQASEPSRSKTDRQYGEGTAEFIAQAVGMYYKE